VREPEKRPEEKRRRGLAIVRRLVAVALVLALVTGGALFAVLYTADAEFIAGAMSRFLGRHVEIGRVTFHFGRRIEVDLEQVKISDPAKPEDPPLVEVASAHGIQAWPRLLAGQYLPLDWTLDAPLLRFHASESGSIDLSGLPRLGLNVTNGRVEVTTASREVWSLDRLQLEARRAGFGTRLEGEGSARVSRGETPVTELAMKFSASRDGADLHGTVASLDLAALPKTTVTPRGRGDGGFELTLSEGAVKGRVQLDVRRFSLTVPKLSGPIAPSTARVVADVDWKKGSLGVVLHPLELDDLVANGHLRIGTGRNGRLVADLKLEPFEPGHPDRVSALTFLALRFASWARVKSRIEAGVVEDIHLAADVPTATAAESLSYDVALPPNAFVLELRARNGIYRPKPGEPPLENLQGELEIRGEVMDIRRLRITHAGESLPEINVHLVGMHRLVHLPDAEDHVPMGPGVALDGLAPLGDALRAGEGVAREPTVIHFRDLQVKMPQFMLPVRQAEGRLRFPNGGVAAESVRGILGGAPAQITASYSQVEEKVDVDIQYLEGGVTGGPVTGPHWLDAKIDFETLDLPDWPLAHVRARVSGERAIVTFEDLKAELAGGKLRGNGHLDLSQADRAPFDMELRVSGFDPKPMCATFGLPAESVTGRGEIVVTVSGAMHPGGDFGTEGALSGKLLLHDGTVARLPALVAIARLPSLRGVTGLLGSALPYKSVELDISLADGKVAFANGKLLGPELRILGSGEMDLKSPKRETEMVVALLFLQTLDRVLNQLPIVRNVMLGDDQNLIAVYLRVSGPREDPTVTPLPPQSVQSAVGFASRAVVNGVKSLGALIQPRSSEPPKPVENPSSEKP
jgi:hypothetical protein